MYYSALLATPNPKDADVHCIGAATSTSVIGPYTAAADPVFCPVHQGGAIDAAGFHDPDDKSQWVVYKIDGNALGHMVDSVTKKIEPPKDKIMLQRMTSDGLKATTDSPVELLTNEATIDGEVVEAPSLAKIGSTYILFYSSHWWNTEFYDAAYAVSSSIAGPYNKISRSGKGFKLLQSGLVGSVPLVGPGGLDVSSDGKRIVFHGWDSLQALRNGTGKRVMYTGQIQLLKGAGVKSVSMTVSKWCVLALFYVLVATFWWS
jgi:Glycosyl hydrolases family 43